MKMSFNEVENTYSNDFLFSEETIEYIGDILNKHNVSVDDLCHYRRAMLYLFENDISDMDINQDHLVVERLIVEHNLPIDPLRLNDYKNATMDVYLRELSMSI